MGLFASLNSEDAFENEHKLDTLYQGSLFKSIEYEISNIVSKIDNISKAILEILNSLTSDDIRKVLQDYAYTLNMVKSNITVRFSLKSAVLFTRIQQVIKSIELDNDGVNDLTIP